VNRDEEEPELPDREKETDRDDPLRRDLGPPYEKNCGEGRQREAQSDEEQRRECLEPDVDGDEVDAPQQRDGRGEEVMAKRHWPSTG